jgi:dethiobiotin synthetase
MKGCFVTGTDTGVGKTLVSAALLHALARHHGRVVGMKPVAAGADWVDGEFVNGDVTALRAASTVRVTRELDNPVLLRDAVSPHIAARNEGRAIDIQALRRCHRQLTEEADFVVVEGAGGFHVPLSDLKTGADLATALALPVVLVVGLRLGCLNHSLLTAEALRARGLHLAGWVANRIDPAMQEQQENIAYLRSRLHAPLLADIPFHARPQPRDIAIDLPLRWKGT